MVEPAGSAAGEGGSWGVAALLAALARTLDERFSVCTVHGELSGFTRAASGHCYFTLKDAEGAAAALRCAMFRRAATLMGFTPRDGARVELRGRVALYEPRGEMQFVVESMRPLGEGALYEQFLRLKAKLKAEGLFDTQRKRALPAFPRCVGVVTSLAGAALHDVLTTLARRSPQVAVVVYPSLVQGAEAPTALVAAFEAAAQRREADLLIVARGGGSIEDLWAFNDERVVRALAALPIPTIAGVGHETDVTLVDFAADLRSATPTAAAEQAAPARDELLNALQALARRVAHQVRHRLDREAQRLDQRALQLARPVAWVHREATRLQALAHRLQRGASERLGRAREAVRRVDEHWRHVHHMARLQRQSRLEAFALRLAALDPQRPLTQGYALVQTADGTLVRHPQQLHAGDALQLTLAEGQAEVTLASARAAR